MASDDSRDDYIAQDTRVLRLLQGGVIDEGLGDILQYLHEPSDYTMDRIFDSDDKLHIQMYTRGQQSVYVSASGQFYRVVSTPGKPQITRFIRGPHWPRNFEPPGVFGRIKELKDGLRIPIDPKALALVQYLCLYKGVGYGLPKRFPMPDYDLLLAALKLVDYRENFEIIATSYKNPHLKQTQRVLPAGPEAITAVRNILPGYLLARLPPLSNVQFSEHSKKLGWSRLCLRLGRYSKKSTDKGTNPVYAYMYPCTTGKIGPTLLMEVGRRFNHNQFELEKVTWNHDISNDRVKLEPFANEARSYAELYAVMKYYFLLATEAKLYGHENHIVPINITFLNLLTRACNRSYPATAKQDDTDKGHMDVNQSLSPNPHARRRGVDLNSRSKARPRRRSETKDEPMSASVGNDDDHGSEHSLSKPKTKKVKYTTGPGFNIRDENTDMEDNNDRAGHFGKHRSDTHGSASSAKKRPLAAADIATMNRRNGAQAHQVRSSVAVRKKTSSNASPSTPADMMDIDG